MLPILATKLQDQEQLNARVRTLSSHQRSLALNYEV